MLGLVSPFATTIIWNFVSILKIALWTRELIAFVRMFFFIALEKCLSSFSHIFPFLYFSFYSSPVCCLLIILYHTNNLNEHFVLLI